ncbi:MaoC family dehydratase [Sphingopyxis sp.]|jgi:acyl dehydratase|uniref:MaoC family dehydratase n=1 Tax=Sphingopyxis sp. TaxID=1908224 RepID=UPI002DF13914|nr:MaoC family dehydratase [Sphingopyxis sp.]
MMAAMTLPDFAALAGNPVGTSSWMTVDQDQIDAFARCTHVEQFIHVDPERAAQTIFGTTIAHGFLTLSLLSAMSYETIPRIEGATMSVNYGFDSVRFISPVKVGSRIRGIFHLFDCTERKPGHWLSRISVKVEIEGANSPALAAEWLIMTVLGDG